MSAGNSIPPPLRASDAPECVSTFENRSWAASGLSGPYGTGFDLAIREEEEAARSAAPLTLPYFGEIEGGPPRSTLPGGGSKGPGCGEVHPVGWVCRSALHPKPRVPLGADHCDRRECPLCAGSHTAKECEVGLRHRGGRWAHSEAMEVRSKLEGYLRTLPGSISLRQVIVSPAPERYDENSDHCRVVARVRSAAQKAVRELAWGPGKADYLSRSRGPDGKRTGEETYKRGAFGSIVVHLYRGCERDGYNRWGPHAHVLCGGIDSRLTKAYEERTGVIVKQANGASGRFLEYSGFRLLRHLVYELGHAAILPGAHAVSYFGAGLIRFHPPEEETEPTLPKCECGSDMETVSSVYGMGARFVRTLDGPAFEYLGAGGLRVVRVETYDDPHLKPPPGPKRGPPKVRQW